MRREVEININTAEYWDACYIAEQGSNKQRVDMTRMMELTRWIRVREEELGRSIWLLDIGCGLGDVAKCLVHADVRVTGLDVSAYAIETCRALIKGAVFDIGQADALPYEHEVFDLVWIGETLEHCNDPEKVIAEAKRVCTEHGFIIISTPYRGRNRSPEHVWEFEPKDIVRWGTTVGDLVFLDCKLLPRWETMFAVMRRSARIDPS